MRVFGVLDSNGCHVDVSKTERGAKRYARLNGYNKVTCRFEYNALILFELVNNKWKELKSVNKL